MLNVFKLSEISLSILSCNVFFVHDIVLWIKLLCIQQLFNKMFPLNEKLLLHGHVFFVFCHFFIVIKEEKQIFPKSNILCDLEVNKMLTEIVYAKTWFSFCSLMT